LARAKRHDVDDFAQSDVMLGEVALIAPSVEIIGALDGQRHRPVSSPVHKLQAGLAVDLTRVSNEANRPAKLPVIYGLTLAVVSSAFLWFSIYNVVSWAFG
jgi:hypothetical protein